MVDKLVNDIATHVTPGVFPSEIIMTIHVIIYYIKFIIEGTK